MSDNLKSMDTNDACEVVLSAARHAAKIVLRTDFKRIEAASDVLEDFFVNVVNNADTDMAAARLREEHGGHWRNHPNYSHQDWMAEVANNDTRLGYWQWVASQVEQADEEDKIVFNVGDPVVAANIGVSPGPFFAVIIECLPGSRYKIKDQEDDVFVAEESELTHDE